MIKRFIKDTAIYSFNNVITMGISIFLVPIYTRIFSPSDYGIIDIVAVITNLVNLTIALEISQAVARFYPDEKDQQSKIIIASTALWFTIFVYCIFLLVSWLFATPLSLWVFGATGKELLFQIAMASIFFSGILYTIRSQLRWQLQSKHFSIVAITQSLTTVGLKILLVVIFDYGLAGVFLGLLGGQLIGCILAYIFARYSYRLVFDFGKLKAMLAFSSPLVISSIGVYVSLYIDRIAIRELMSLNEVGLYGIGFRVASLVTLIMIGCQGALTPLVYHYYREIETPQKIATIFRYFVAAALIVFLGLSIFSKEILIIFTTEAYYSGYVVVPFLIPAKLLFGMYIFAPGLGIAKKTKITTVINLSAAFLNMGLNFTLIPFLGIIGAALATVISALIMFIIRIIVSNKHYIVPYEWAKIIISSLIITIMVIIGVLLPSNLWTIMLKSGFIAIGVVVIFLILIEKKEVSIFIGLFKNTIYKIKKC